jgi:hypothetical protein
MKKQLNDSWVESILSRNLDIEKARKKCWKGRKNKDIKRWKLSFPASEQCDCCFSTSIEINIITDLQGKVQDLYPEIKWYKIDNQGCGFEDTMKVSFSRLDDEDGEHAAELIEDIVMQ